MAKRPVKAGKAAPARAAKATSKKVAEVDVAVEDKPGMGVDAALAVGSTVLLLAAILFMDKLLAKIAGSGAGVFF